MHNSGKTYKDTLDDLGKHNISIFHFSITYTCMMPEWIQISLVGN